MNKDKRVIGNWSLKLHSCLISLFLTAAAHALKVLTAVWLDCFGRFIFNVTCFGSG